jgi:crotonobetainyl-CoA:carnitine CoA-transferase CaiB-like acyl-CoA transferase
MWCVIAILAALRERDRTGDGATLDIAMTDGVLGFATATLGGVLAGAAPGGGGVEPLTGGIAPYNTYLAKDGRAMTLAALEPKFWASFCAGVGLEVEMSAFMPGAHQAKLKERVAEIFRSRTRDEWVAFAAERDCCLEPVLAPGEITSDAHLRERELLFEIPSGRGPIPQVRTPVTPRGTVFSPAPRAGEHTRAILREGGIPEEEIDGLIRGGVAREAAE